jgi:kynurenine formamidase
MLMNADSSDVTEDEVLAYFDSCSNWGRWGEDDELGTLNFLTPELVARASSSVSTGQSISCSRFLAPRPSRWIGYEYLHRMNSSGEAAPKVGAGAATDWFGLSFHGFEHTHLDSHSHLFWNGKMYNDRNADLCTTARGALIGGVEPALGGIIGRGLLVDGPLVRDKAWLEPGEGIGPKELDSWFASRGTEPESGDILWLRTGRDAAEAAGQEYDLGFDGSPGLAASCLPWLRAHDISMIVSDVATDVRPTQYEKMPDPVHIVGIVAMGLWVVDNAAMGELSVACSTSGRYEFMSVVVPLALRRATGSPVNPIAIF